MYSVSQERLSAFQVVGISIVQWIRSLPTIWPLILGAFLLNLPLNFLLENPLHIKQATLGLGILMASAFMLSFLVHVFIFAVMICSVHYFLMARPLMIQEAIMIVADKYLKILLTMIIGVGISLSVWIFAALFTILRPRIHPLIDLFLIAVGVVITVYLMVAFIYSIVSVTIENISPMAALKRSFVQVKDHWWFVFTGQFLIILIYKLLMLGIDGLFFAHFFEDISMETFLAAPLIPLFCTLLLIQWQQLQLRQGNA